LFQGEIAIPTLFSPRDWHAHEMLFGYVPAVLADFLLTAIPNWTGRLPLQGTPFGPTSTKIPSSTDLDQIERIFRAGAG
jgi:hypothetical protein